jgi:uncharacterized protein (TIGR03437 family)
VEHEGSNVQVGQTTLRSRFQIAYVVVVVLLLAVTALAGQAAQGTIFTSSVTAAPNTAFNVPVTLALNAGANVDGLTFAVSVTPQNGAPDPAPIGFTAGASISQSTSPLVTSVKDNVGVFFLLPSPVTGTVLLGQVTGTIPSSATSGQTYTVSVTIVSPSYQGKAVPVALGPDSTLTVGTPTISLSPATLQFTAQQGGANPASQGIIVTNSGAGTLSWTASVTGGNWLSVSPVTQNVGTKLTASVNIAGLAAGSYTSTIQVSSGAATNSPQTIAVSLTVTALPLPVIALSTTALSFTAQQSGANPSTQTVTISNSGAGTLNWTAAVASGTWLSVSPASGAGQGTLTVSANVGGLAVNTYTGAIQVSASGSSNSPQTINVTLVITAAPPAPAIALNPSALTFAAQQGGSNPTSQTVSLANSGGGTLNWTAAAATGAWLSVSPASGSGAATLTVAANVAGLAAGTYNGTIQVSATGASNTPQTLPVTLTVTAAASISLTPAALQFSAVAGANPPAQSFQVLNTLSGSFGWTAAAATQSGGNWLSVTPTTGVTPATLSVSIASSTLAKGSYSGSITIAGIAGTTLTNSPQTLPVTLAVGALTPVIGQGGIVNGASFAAGSAVSPGSIVSLFGSNLALTTETAVVIPLPTTLAGGTQVLVNNNVAAPLFYVSPGQINFQMPIEATGSSVPVAVVSGGITSLTATVNGAPAVPGIFFTTSSAGTAQGVVLNQDYSANSPQNPAAAGSVIQIFATGLGSTNPALATGQPGSASDPYNLTVIQPVVSINGLQADLLFSGVAPNFVGLYQVNVRVPQIPSTSTASLQIRMNNQTSNTTTIAIR